MSTAWMDRLEHPTFRRAPNHVAGLAATLAGLDNPDLLREDRILPIVLEILATDLSDPPLIRADVSLVSLVSLVELGRRLVDVTRELAQNHHLKKARGIVVLAWCHINILRTTQHYLDADGAACLSPAMVAALANVKVRAVVFNILVDELADDVQDRELFARFCQIPFGADGRIAALSPARARALRSRVRAPWTAYFDLAVTAWNSVIQSLLGLVGIEAFEAHREQLGDDYRKIFECMDYALDLNSSPTCELLMRPGGGELLAHNMNMMAFETFDRMALRMENPALDARLSRAPHRYRELRSINRLLQHNGQIGNSTTTIDAEIDENCIANEVIQNVGPTLGPVACELFVRRKRAWAAGDLDACAELGARIRELIRRSGALATCFERWMSNRGAVVARLEDPALREWVDPEAWLAAHDTLLATSWVFRGTI